MSYDASSLRGTLQRIDGSAPSIQSAAASMMKHYDKSPGVAVNCWRDMLMQAKTNQFLPLLYVANEVLQNSKRNRGNKFLEAFSPILGQALIFVCGKSPTPVVESIRRTVKIWAERRVFSIRYVNELIKGLEPYRTGGSKRSTVLPTTSSVSQASSSPGNQSPGGGRFSPVTSLERPSQSNAEAGNLSKAKTIVGDNDDDDNMFGGDDSDDDNDLFGNASKKILQIDVDFDRAAANSVAESGGTKKRRRASNESNTANTSKSPKSKRRASAQHLSTSRLMEVMNQVSSLQARFDTVRAKLQEFETKYSESDSHHIDSSLVGDALLTEFRKILADEDEVQRYQRDLHSMAQAKKSLELEALRYLPWLEQALNQDREDIEFSKMYRRQLQLFQNVYRPAKQARDKRLREESLRIEREEALRQKQLEEEDRRKFMESAMSRQTEAQPGMVWNRATGEYQHLNQEESWRD